MLAALVADLKAQAPDHIAVTGDLVNLSLPTNLRRRAPGSTRSGAPHDVTLVPGNHDAYVRAAAGLPQRHWGDYMRGDARRRAFRSCAGAGRWR